MNRQNHWEKSSNEYRHEELIRKIEYSLKSLSTGELEALYYDMISKGYING